MAEHTETKKHLIVMRRPPYGSSLARASVDLALAMGAFEQSFDLLFLGDGVLQLLDDQDASAIGRKTIGKVLASLPLYDVNSVYVDAAALARHALTEEQLVVPVVLLDTPDMQALMAHCDHLVSC